MSIALVVCTSIKFGALIKHNSPKEKHAFILIHYPNIITKIMTSMLNEISPNAQVVSRQQALTVNTSAAVGLMQVLQTNLGPTGTLKLLVGGAGQLSLTKDGLKLLRDMQIQHPTAALIARTATAQDDITGDGTTSTVLLVGELLRQSHFLVQQQGLHPRVVADGLDVARDACLDFLKDPANRFTVPVEEPVIQQSDVLLSTARTSLSTKLDASLAPAVRFWMQEFQVGLFLFVY